MEDRRQHLVGLEIGSATAEMDITTGGEAPFFVEDDADAPDSSFNGLLAVAAFGLSAAGFLGTVGTGNAGVFEARECRSPEGFLVGYACVCLLFQCIQEWLRAFVRRTEWMEP